MIEQAKQVYLFRTHISLIEDHIVSRKKRIIKKLSPMIHAEWYDLSEQEIENRIRQKNREFDLLCDLHKRILVD